MRSNKKISAFSEWGLLTGQYVRILLSDKRSLTVMLLFPIIAVVITVWVAGSNMFVHYEGTKSACFVIVSAAIWGGLFNSIQTIVKERANIKRDYIAGLRIYCYVLARALVQCVLCMIQSLILCLSFYGVQWCYNNALPESGQIFSNPILEYYISVFLLLVAADAMGLLISSIVEKAETASVLAPYILIIQLIFSGILFPMEGAADKLSYLTLSRWGMEAMGCISCLNDLPLKIHKTVPNVPHEAEKMFISSQSHLITVWIVLFLFIFIFLLCSIICLHRVSKDAR